MTRQLDELLTNQWAQLWSWITQTEVAVGFDEASVLDGWTVRDLIGHLGRALSSITLVSESDDRTPLSLLAYVSNYGPAAETIAQETRGLVSELGDEVLSRVDCMALEGLKALASLRSEVVLGPRGRIRREDYVITRLLELVVHADDLGRSLPHLTPPRVKPKAIEVVADVLSSAYREKTGSDRDWQASDQDWLRIATGRLMTLDPALPLL